MLILSYRENERNDRVFNSILETIGNTPLVRLNKIKKEYQLYGDIFAKLEFFNPLSSVKDRIGLSMIENAESWYCFKNYLRDSHSSRYIKFLFTVINKDYTNFSPIIRINSSR